MWLCVENADMTEKVVDVVQFCTTGSMWLSAVPSSFVLFCAVPCSSVCSMQFIYSSMQFCAVSFMWFYVGMCGLVQFCVILCSSVSSSEHFCSKTIKLSPSNLHFHRYSQTFQPIFREIHTLQPEHSHWISTKIHQIHQKPPIFLCILTQNLKISNLL